MNIQLRDFEFCTYAHNIYIPTCFFYQTKSVHGFIFPKPPLLVLRGTTPSFKGEKISDKPVVDFIGHNSYFLPVNENALYTQSMNGLVVVILLFYTNLSRTHTRRNNNNNNNTNPNDPLEEKRIITR